MKLIHTGFDVGLGPTLALIMDYYARLLTLLLGWSEPYINDAFERLRGLIALDLHIHAHWRYIFVLMMVYFGARLRSMSTVGNQVGNYFVWTLIALGVFAALIGSIAAGTIPIEDSPSQWSTAMLMAAFPVAGALIFDLGEISLTSIFRRHVMASYLDNPDPSHLQVFWFLAKKVFFRFGVAAFFLALCTQADKISMLRTLPSPGLLALGALVILTALYWLEQGGMSVRRRQSEGKSWLRTFFSIGSTRVGTEIVMIILFVVGTMVVNAGLNPLGL